MTGSSTPHSETPQTPTPDPETPGSPKPASAAGDSGASVASTHIQRLAPHLVNQIAAGEVIERPASVVKELVENAIDAGAVNITVELEEGGKRLIRVTDDGGGIPAAELELAVASHATSKLRDESSLHSVATLGFRGEALASIGSVSEFEVASRPPGQPNGETYLVADGKGEPGPPEGMATGTRVTVRRLFYNVPARKRFLKSDRAEVGRIRATVERLALAIPDVGFTLTSDGRTLLRCPGPQDPLLRVKAILGDTLGKSLVPLVSTDDRIRGWIATPEVFRRNSEATYLFLNGRFIRDKTILHALREGYKAFQIPGRYPVAVLFIDLDPSEVDVNVHPTKQEVRFRDTSMLHRLVRRAVNDTLLTSRRVPSLLPSDSSTQNRPIPPSTLARDPADGAPSSDRIAPLGSAQTPYEKSQFPLGTSRVADAFSDAAPREEAATHRPLSSPTADDSDPRQAAEVAKPRTDLPVSDLPVSESQVAEREPTQELIAQKSQRVFQINNAYLVVEEAEGMTVIDQHALHEKILYEEILEARERGTIKQALLLPETVRLDGTEWETFSEVQEALAELGFDADEFGDDTVVLRSVPIGWESTDAVGLFREALRKLREALDRGASTAIELRDQLVETMACKQAVKAGQRLAPEEQLELLRGRSRAFHPQNCPHGRPSELFISWAELDRRFDRK